VDRSLKSILLKQDGASPHFNYRVLTCRKKHFPIVGSAGLTQFHGNVFMWMSVKSKEQWKVKKVS
jgi:hypothetical protein